MDIRTDSVNDILCHYGISPGAGREYINGIISHGLFGIPTGKEKAEMEAKQRNADIRLLNAYKEKKEKLELDLYKMELKLKEHESERKDADSLVMTAESDLARALKLGNNSELVSRYRDALDRAKKFADRCRSRCRTTESDISKIKDEILDMDSKIIPLELSLKQRAR